MPYARPTLSALREQARAAIESRLPGADAGLRFSALGVLADVIAAAQHLQHGHLDWIVRQCLPDSAEGEYLTRWATLYGIARKPATRAAGHLTLTGISGTVLPSGRELTRADGTRYVTTAAATIGGGGTATVPVEALAGGDAGNAPEATRLTLSLAVVGLEGSALVAAGGLTGGAGEEADADLRARLLQRLRQPPQGGAARDYIAWALELPSVTRAWVRPLWRGVGTLDVFFVCDRRDNIIPTLGDVAEMQDYLDARRPVTADVLALAPVAVPLDVTITALTPDTAAVRAAIVAELRAQISIDASPGGTIFRSRLSEAVSRASDEFSHFMSAPAGDVTHATNELAVLGTVTFS